VALSFSWLAALREELPALRVELDAAALREELDAAALRE
jgi:hypothetical protein